MSQLTRIVPLEYGKYFEPFLGGGALYFALLPTDAILSDTNSDLVNCYHQIRTNPDSVAELLSKFENSESAYYRVRSDNSTTPIERAARFIYLTTLAFNGIYRVNLRGEFNVPYGHKTHLKFPDQQLLRAYSAALRPAQIVEGDFQSATQGAVAGDLIYFDPPYTLAHSNNGFVKYNENIFQWEDQERLASCAKALVARGCVVLVSNADHAEVRALYSDFQELLITRSSKIAASAQHRRPITECIFIGGDTKHVG